MYVMVTGTGRKLGLGFNLAKRYLEHGDQVIATVRKPSEALEELKKQYPDTLHILTMDIGSTPSVNAAAEKAKAFFPCLDLIVNNAVTTSKDTMKELEDFDLDQVAPVINVASVGPLRVLKAFLPLLKAAKDTALVVNVSSEAGSIGRCYRTYYIDYGMAKAALNMATMTMRNKFRDDPQINIICIHPGWVRTSENSEAPLDPYEHAETLRLLFEKKRHDKEGPVFVTHTGDPYPW